jgi:hypothetical protein
MPNYNDLDISGSDPIYYVDTYNRVLYKSPQKLEFDVPVFVNSTFEIIDTGGGVPTNLVLNTDFIISPDDIDTDAIAFVKSIDITFDLILVKSITVVRPYVEDRRILCKFNQLHASNISYTNINTDPVNITPELIGEMISEISYLQQMILATPDNNTIQSNGTRILDEYINGDNNANIITDELHTVNVIDDISRVRPVYGTFFKDSVTITNLIGDILEYEVLELDIERTERSTNTSGIYSIINIISPMVGDIKVSYRACGGVPDIISSRDMKDTIANIENYIVDTTFVTSGTMSNVPIITTVLNKIQQMENDMRLLLQNGLPSYGDVSTGTAVLKKLIAIDTNIHWWSIATLYRVEGSETDIIADVLKFRIKSLYADMMFECSVAVNTETSASNRMVVRCANENISDSLFEVSVPMLRLIEVTSGSGYSGVVLQLGMKLGAGILQETVDIEDMSGKESCWKMVPFVANSINPEDDNILMPDEVSTFVSGSNGHLVDSVVVPFNGGVNITTIGSTTNMTLDTTTPGNEVIVSPTLVDMVSMISIVDIDSISIHAQVDNGVVTDIDMRLPVSSVDMSTGKVVCRNTISAGSDAYDVIVILDLSGDGELTYNVEGIGNISSTTIDISDTKVHFI